jgi:hypothetical protein
MAIRIRRRGFIVTLGSMAVARPLVAALIDSFSVPRSS